MDLDTQLSCPSQKGRGGVRRVGVAGVRLPSAAGKVFHAGARFDFPDFFGEIKRVLIPTRCLHGHHVLSASKSRSGTPIKYPVLVKPAEPPTASLKCSKHVQAAPDHARGDLSRIVLANTGRAFAGCPGGNKVFSRTTALVMPRVARLNAILAPVTPAPIMTTSAVRIIPAS